MNNMICDIVKGVKIPSQPKVLIDINNENSKQNPDQEKIIDLIRQDVALSAKILKIVNSSYFGLKYKANSVKTAYLVLGKDNFINSVFATSLRKSLKGNGISSDQFDIYFNHSLVTAKFAQLIVKAFPSVNNDSLLSTQAYIAGLFHDCGMPLIAARFPDYFEKIGAKCSPVFKMRDIENYFFQTDHSIIGAFMARSWNLPDSVCEIIEHHHSSHNETLSNTPYKNLLSIVKLADYLAVVSGAPPVNFNSENYISQENINSITTNLVMDSYDFEKLKEISVKYINEL